MAMTQEQQALAESVYAKDPTTGARKLMRLTRCTRWSADVFLNNMRVGAFETRAKKPIVFEKSPLETSPAPAFGIPLRNVRVAERRPSDCGMRRQLYSLKKATGFPVEELAEKWGVSQETLRKHAKRLDCLLFVEAEPGDWKHCILHPDTAEAYRKGDAE